MSTCTVVDQDDRVVDYLPIDELLPGDIYRISALWLCNTAGQILIAQRSATKTNDPNRWGPAVAGTVEQGETYESNILKEMAEELNLYDVALGQGPKTFINDNGYGLGYFVQAFIGTLDRPVENFVLQTDEVAQVRWINLEELQTWLQSSPIEFTAGFSTCLEAGLPLLQKPVQTL